MIQDIGIGAALGGAVLLILRLAGFRPFPLQVGETNLVISLPSTVIIYSILGGGIALLVIGMAIGRMGKKGMDEKSSQ